MIIALASIVVVVLVITGGAVVIGNVMSRSTQPSDPWTTPPREKTPALPTKPEQQQGDGFTFTSPAGWTRAEDWGDKNDAKIVDAAGNDITVYIFPAANAKQRCQSELKALEAWVPGTISGLPDRTIDGEPAPGGQLEGEDTYRMHCVLTKGAIFNISLQSDPADIEETGQAFTAVLDSWQWS